MKYRRSNNIIPDEVYFDMNRLSQFVKERRKLLGITQADLAFKSGVGLRFIRDLEQGKKTLRMDKVNQVLIMFGQELGVVERDRGGFLNDEEFPND